MFYLVRSDVRARVQLIRLNQCIDSKQLRHCNASHTISKYVRFDCVGRCEALRRCSVNRIEAYNGSFRSFEHLHFRNLSN